MSALYTYTLHSELRDLPISVQYCALFNVQKHWIQLMKHSNMKWKSGEMEIALKAQVCTHGKAQVVQDSTQTVFKYAITQKESDENDENNENTQPLHDCIQFEEQLQFGLTIADIQKNTCLAITLIDREGMPLAGTCLPLVNSKGLIRQGQQKCWMHLNCAADGKINSKTPHKPQRKMTYNENIEFNVSKSKFKAYQAVPWLDALSEKAIRTHKPNTPELFMTLELATVACPIVYFVPSFEQSVSTLSSLLTVYDPYNAYDDPIEIKNQTLARAAFLKGGHNLDQNIKPSHAERRIIANIVTSATRQLTQPQKDMLWRFRLSLTEDPRALTKFLRSVNFDDPNESKQALQLLDQWVPIDIADALELLGSHVMNEGVRVYAVSQLYRADDQELMSYLLQLVQALRYERHYPSSLSNFLVHRCINSWQLTNFVHWYLLNETHDVRQGSRFAEVHRAFIENLKQQKPEWYQHIRIQEKFIQDLACIASDIRTSKNRHEKKLEFFRELFNTKYAHLQSVDVTCPVRPELPLQGLLVDSSTLFKSALTPMLLAFKGSTQYKVIFKSGDDLRQDQLIIQMINLMDILLKKVRLDLQLTTYRVLATGPTDGFVEYVTNSYTVSHVLETYDRDILRFLRFYNTSPETLDRALDNFCKSCAGYCVITFLLGIGDRHLENVLITTQGHLFHIDFGFAFGRDPKPFPPPMKVSKEMIDCMKAPRLGAEDGYSTFQRLCALSYNILRQHSSLIINLLSLMLDANIPDLDGDDKIVKVQEKFRLDLSDEEAGIYIHSLIDQSVTALFPQVIDRLHYVAGYWK